MEPFTPGLDYGSPYDVMIWVCVNPTTRSFEKCDIPEGQAVLSRLKQLVQAKGLGNRVMVTASGCLLGCKSKGTTIAMTFRLSAGLKQDTIVCFNNVTVADLPDLLEQYIH